MSRHRSRIVIAVLICVLAFAASAHAECAWVLWEDMILAKKKTSPEPVRAYATKPDCDRALSDALESRTNVASGESQVRGTGDPRRR